MKRHDSRNAYEVEFPIELNVLNVYHEGGDGIEVAKVQWSILVASSITKEIEKILDSHVGKSTMKRTYEEYLVKWKGRPIEDSSWLAREEVDRLGFPLNT